MKIVLFGMNGQLGWELQRALAPLGEVHCFGHVNSTQIADLSDPKSIGSLLIDLKPQVVFNAAAYTDVDRAETERELAFRINAESPAAMAEAAKQLGALLVHYSTDYVFDGSGTIGHSENDPTAPLNVYGESKRLGEQLVAATGCVHLIFRASWVYGTHGHNFLKTILRLVQERQQLSIVADQIGAPTGAELLADASVHAALKTLHDNRLSGTYHLCAEGQASWHSYASFICENAKKSAFPMITTDISAIASSDYHQKARRPLNSRLNCQKFKTAFCLRLPHWQEGVVRTLNELKPAAY